MSNAIADYYRRFAELEARGISGVYDDWASSIADDPEVIALIADLPGMKKQANLVFAAARLMGAPVGPYPAFREWLLAHWAAVVPVILARSTQTNEAARCAVLLPVLEGFTGPVALIEAGASAGLVLYPDKYSYHYDTGAGIVALDPLEGPSPVQLPCSIVADRVPARLPEVVWRAGVDLNPIDVRDADEVDWLEALIWPEHDARRERLHQAVALAAQDPPHLVAGDLIDKIPELVAAAPAGAHVVVFHSAVLVYLSAEGRAEFAELMASMPQVTWVSNEGAGTLPQVTAKVSAEINGRTILAVNGEPVALVGPHGQSYQQL